MLPNRLKLSKNDEIRVIAPSRSLSFISDDIIGAAAGVFAQMGLKVSFSRNARNMDGFNSSSVQERIDDLHDAFLDDKVKGVIAATGGYNVNQLLSHIDYTLIKEHPKVVCGYSDITALLNAIHAKTGITTFHGPNFSTFGMKRGNGYALESFFAMTMGRQEAEIVPSEEWSNDAWYADQDDRHFIRNEGYWILNEGKAEGTLKGGNLNTFNLLTGTPYAPSIRDSILFFEENHASSPEIFDRYLQSIVHLPDFSTVRGLVVGRFEIKSGVTRELLTEVVRNQGALRRIPVVANVDFGHTSPMLTLPVGGWADIDTERASVLHVRVLP